MPCCGRCPGLLIGYARVSTENAACLAMFADLDRRMSQLLGRCEAILAGKSPDEGPAPPAGVVIKAPWGRGKSQRRGLARLSHDGRHARNQHGETSAAEGAFAVRAGRRDAPIRDETGCS